MDVNTRERGGFDPGPRGACLHVVGRFDSCWQGANWRWRLGEEATESNQYWDIDFLPARSTARDATGSLRE